MKKSIKYILFILITLLVLLFGLWVYIYPPLPAYEGSISLKELSDTVNVYTDDFGVPHIFAKNESDLFLTAGYIAARERLFQKNCFPKNNYQFPFPRLRNPVISKGILGF